MKPVDVGKSQPDLVVAAFVRSEKGFKILQPWIVICMGAGLQGDPGLEEA